MVNVAERQVNLSDPSLYINRELSWFGFDYGAIEPRRRLVRGGRIPCPIV